MKLKTLVVFGEKTKEVAGAGIGAMGGHTHLYPEGTRRNVRSYFLFPRTLNGETRRGFQVVEQVAYIDFNCSEDGTIPYNGWRNSRFISDSSLVKKL
jgi:hypothetical protein